MKFIPAFVLVAFTTLIPLTSSAFEIQCKETDGRGYLKLSGDSKFLTGEDSANPVECSLERFSREHSFYFCGSYQGAPYLKFKVENSVFEKDGTIFILNADYVDENEMDKNDDYKVTQRIPYRCKIHLQR